MKKWEVENNRKSHQLKISNAKSTLKLTNKSKRKKIINHSN